MRDFKPVHEKRGFLSGIRNKIFPSLERKRRIVMTKKRPDNLGGDAIYIQVRPSEFKMRIIGKPAIEKYFVRIYSAQEFVFPELGRLNPDINLIDLNDYGGMCEAFYSIGAIGRQFSNMNQIVRELLKDNRGKLEYISQ